MPSHDHPQYQSSKPDDRFLFLSENKDYLSFLADLERLHTNLLGFGTKVLGKSSDNSSELGDVHIAPIMLFRHFLEILDGARLSASEGQTGSYHALFRVALEAFWYLEFMLKEHMKLRATAFIVDNTLNKIDWYEGLDPETETGKRFRSDVKKDQTLPNSAYSDIDLVQLRDASNNLKKMLNKEPYLSVYDEWKRVKKKNHRRPKWYGLYSGPNNLQEITRSLGRDAQYVLYRLSSETTHAANTMTGILKLKNSSAAIKPIRFPEELENHVKTLVPCVVNTYQVMINKFCPEVIDEFRYWYFTDIRKGLMSSLKSKNLIFPDIERKSLKK